MKKFSIIAMAMFTLMAFTNLSAVWNNDPAHSQLSFTVKHLGITDVTGTFNDFEVKVTSSKNDFSDAVFELTAKTASINTRVEARDNHLKSADFFDAEKYPELTFKSTSVKKQGKNKYKLIGDLTIHGVTKPVTMDLVHTGKVENPMNQQETAGFQVTGTIKRSDFKIGGEFPTMIISDEVHIKADGEFVQG